MEKTKEGARLSNPMRWSEKDMENTKEGNRVAITEKEIDWTEVGYTGEEIGWQQH